MNTFKDQKDFMVACDQSVDKFNIRQFNMYVDLINEELGELKDAIDQQDRVETLDALVDIIVVTIGAAYSLGCDVEGAWGEVIRSNMSKIDPSTGRVIKRPDGKVLKPVTYSPPDLKPYIKEES